MHSSPTEPIDELPCDQAQDRFRLAHILPLVRHGLNAPEAALQRVAGEISSEQLADIRETNRQRRAALGLSFSKEDG